jgi:hypothetical protein
MFNPFQYTYFNFCHNIQRFEIFYKIKLWASSWGLAIRGKPHPGKYDNVGSQKKDAGMIIGKVSLCQKYAFILKQAMS